MSRNHGFMSLGNKTMAFGQGREGCGVFFFFFFFLPPFLGGGFVCEEEKGGRGGGAGVFFLGGGRALVEIFFPHWNSGGRRENP